MHATGADQMLQRRNKTRSNTDVQHQDLPHLATQWWEALCHVSDVFFGERQLCSEKPLRLSSAFEVFELLILSNADHYAQLSDVLLLHWHCSKAVRSHST